jgi:hypothetical protein
LLAVVFLVGRGDIRQIPGFAAIFVVLSTFGPWNLENLPRWQQGLRLDVLMSKAGPNGESLAGPAAWTDEERQEAIGAITYLGMGDEQDRGELVRVLGIYGYEFGASTVNPIGVVLQLTGQDVGGAAQLTQASMHRDAADFIDMSAFPILIAHVDLYGTGRITAGALRIDLDRSGLWVSTLDGTLSAAQVPLPPFGDGGSVVMDNPLADVHLGGTDYRLVLDALDMVRRADGVVEVTRVSGTLFAAQPPAAEPTLPGQPAPGT